ncbi:MAG TPA: hypothetical protein DHW63_09030 [Hyphomonadaceae bacterium]|nr:hypothetical protein [Hyphomonadaceae bacterium]
MSNMETAPLRFRVKTIKTESVDGWASNPPASLHAKLWPMALVSDCFVLSESGAEWLPDEGGTLSIQFERNFSPPFVGAFGNRVHPGEWAEVGEEIANPDPLEWYHSKYLAYASAPSAFPGESLKSLHERFRQSEGAVLEVSVAHACGGRVPTGIIEGGRITALRFVEND